MYDSSIFPVRNPRYGIPNAKRTPNLIRSGLWEWPISTLPTPLGNIPFAGGVYFRFLPGRCIQAAIRILEKRNEPVIMYLHPWELDPEQPRYKTDSWFLNCRHYYGLQRTYRKLELLIKMNNFTSLKNRAKLSTMEVSV